MPIPVLPVVFLGVSAVAGAKGAKKGIQAGIDHTNAKALDDDSNNRVALAAESLDTTRVQCEEMLEALGQEKLVVLDTSMRRFVNTFEQIKNVDFRDSVGLDELKKLRADGQTLKEMRSSVDLATNLLKGSAAGAMSGAVAAFGAYGAAGVLATASTGTAIASLSGAAASSATLAFFGGGSLAAGGLGMAGGTVVLGGLALGAALLVAGNVLAYKEGKNKEIALQHVAQADQICEELNTAGSKCIAIRRRASMLYATLARADARFLPLVFRMQEILQTEGLDYSLYSQKSKETIARAASMAVTAKTIIDTPLLDDDGDMTEESRQLIETEIVKRP